MLVSIHLRSPFRLAWGEGGGRSEGGRWGGGEGGVVGLVID